jgi:hypothetical protein
MTGVIAQPKAGAKPQAKRLAPVVYRKLVPAPPRLNPRLRKPSTKVPPILSTKGTPRMSQHLRPCLLASAAALFTLAFAIAAPAQTPAPPADATAPHPPRQHRPHPKPVNLQVLPMTLTGDQVVDIMHKFTGGLGVECDYCHAKNPTPTPTTGHLDFASDANPMKDRARTMIRMNEEINQHFLTQLKPPAEHEVGCGTCHRGNAKPLAFVPPPEEHHPDGPPTAGPPPK